MAISASSLSIDSVRAGVVAADYRQAIEVAGSLLVDAGLATAEYSGAMIRVVEELGPYIVIVEGVALAHAAPGSGVLRNGLSVVKLAGPVDFGGGKLVRLVFALAATDHDAHIENLGALAMLLGDEKTLRTLLDSESSIEIHTLLTTAGGE